MNEQVVNISIDDIIPNRFQPREVFRDQALEELALSIKEHGVIQPIIVRQIVNNKYEIIAGERRYKASTIAGKTTIPAIVRNLNDIETSKQALLENIQRQDLTPIEEARTYQTILSLDNITQEELAKTMGKSQSAISNKLRLLTLPEEVQEALLNSEISERHARSLLTIQNVEKQKSLLKEIIQNKIPVRILDEMIKKENEGNNMNDNNLNFVNLTVNNEGNSTSSNFFYDGSSQVNNNINQNEMNLFDSNQNQAVNNLNNEINNPTVTDVKTNDIDMTNPTINEEKTININTEEINKEIDKVINSEQENQKELVDNNFNMDRFKKVDYNTEIKQTITGEEIIGEGLLAGKPVEDEKLESENVIGKIEPVKVPAYVLNQSVSNIESSNLVVNEEKLNEKQLESNTPITNVNTGEVLINQTGGMVLPTNQEMESQNNLSTQPSESIKQLINSQDLKLALIGIGNVINNLKARGIEVKEIRKTYSDHLELTLEIKKN